MEEKNISITIDEKFLDRICLVGLEPISNFILVEQYSDNRGFPPMMSA